MAKVYKISLILKKHEDEGPVYHKQDGQRFSRSETVKLNVNTDYLARVVIRPAMLMLGLSIHGERLDIEVDKPTRSKDSDEDASFYKGKFSTANYDTLNKGKRKEIPFLFEFQNGFSMQASIQGKLYKQGETEHCSWGKALSSIEFECQVKDGQTYLEILKEKYL